MHSYLVVGELCIFFLLLSMHSYLASEVIMLNNQVIIERIGDKMYDKGVTAKQLALDTHIDVSLIYRCLRGEGLLQSQYMITLADYFCCSLDYLLGIDDNDYSRQYTTCPPFGTRLVQLYQKYNTNEYRVMKDTHMSRTSLHDWRYNTRTPSISNLVQLAQYFGCTLDYLVGRDL